MKIVPILSSLGLLAALLTGSFGLVDHSVVGSTALFSLIGFISLVGEMSRRKVFLTPID